MDISEQLGSATTQDEVEPFLELAPELVQKRRSQGRIIWDRFIRNRAAVVGAAALLVLVLFCFVGPYLWTLNPDSLNALSATSTLANPSLAHPLGTDDVGRDTLARAMYGGRVSLLVGFISMLMAIVFGIGIGSSSSWRRARSGRAISA